MDVKEPGQSFTLDYKALGARALCSPRSTEFSSQHLAVLDSPGRHHLVVCHEYAFIEMSHLQVWFFDYPPRCTRCTLLKAKVARNTFWDTKSNPDVDVPWHR
jgi:hypothetical protein